MNIQMTSLSHLGELKRNSEYTALEPGLEGYMGFTKKQEGERASQIYE